MNYTVASHYTKVVEESLNLLREYHKAGYNFAKVNEDAQRLATRYRGASVSSIPVTIGNSQYSTSIDAVAFVAAIMKSMWQQRDILHDPYGVCVEGLQFAHDHLSRGRRITIRRIPATMPLYEFSAPGYEPILLPELSLVAVVGALHIRNFDADDLGTEAAHITVS
ncbi:MAG TPA: hypothetical protein VF914_11285 [Chloroflexia bacterium]|jgi:hypothetical protein